MQSQVNSSLRISHHFSEPPQRVWQAWTDPEMVMSWFGSDPKGIVLAASLDVHVDGIFEVTFRNSDETQYTCTGRYKEVEPDQKLVFTWTWKDHPEIVELVTIIFQPEPNGTVMVFEHSNIDAGTTHNYEMGWKSTFAKLERALAEKGP